MTRVDFLRSLKAFTEEAVEDLLMPVRKQRTDEYDVSDRAANVFIQRMPDMESTKKKTPYIMHQILTGNDVQKSGNRSESSVLVRTVFCIYNTNNEEGPLMLLNLMERLRIQILKKRTIADRYRIDMEKGIETLQYTDDTAPYFAGEMVSYWNLPCVDEEVRQWLQ